MAAGDLERAFVHFLETRPDKVKHASTSVPAPAPAPVLPYSHLGPGLSLSVPVLISILRDGRLWWRPTARVPS